MVGAALQAAAGRAEGIYVELELARIHSWQRLELGWPEFARVEPAAAAGVRGWCGLVLRCANERGEELAEHYVMQGAS